MSDSQEKETLVLCLLGHVDCGKSLLNGRLLWDLGGIDDRSIGRVEYDDYNFSLFSGNRTNKYTHILRRNRDERRRGITIKWWVSKAETEKFLFSIVDVPGHCDFMKNTIRGIYLSDVSILVVSAAMGGFETGISGNGQTREHILLSYALGVKQMIVVVNKMDDEGVSYSESRFDEIAKDISRVLTSTGYKPNRIPIIPISAWKGDNLSEGSENMKWWKSGKGKWGGCTLFELINQLKVPKKEREKMSRKPLRITILDVFKISGIGTVPIGRIEGGVLESQTKLIISKTEKKKTTMVTEKKKDEKLEKQKYYRVRSLEHHHCPVESQHAGSITAFNIRGLSTKEIQRYSFVGKLGETPYPRHCQRFLAQIIMIRKVSKMTVGYEPIVHIHGNAVACRIDEIVERRNKRTLELIGSFFPKILKYRELGKVVLRPLKNLMVERFRDYSKLGRFVIRDMRNTIAVGVVLEVDYEGKMFEVGKKEMLELGLRDLKERSLDLIERIIGDEEKEDGIVFSIQCYLSENILVYKSFLY